MSLPSEEAALRAQYATYDSRASSPGRSRDEYHQSLAGSCVCRKHASLSGPGPSEEERGIGAPHYSGIRSIMYAKRTPPARRKPPPDGLAELALTQNSHLMKALILFEHFSELCDQLPKEGLMEMAMKRVVIEILLTADLPPLNPA